MENSMENPQKIKDQTIKWSSYSSSGYLTKEYETNLLRYVHTYAHHSIIYKRRGRKIPSVPN